MRRDETFFNGQELELIYIARKLKEALAVEELLTVGGFEYLVEPDEYRGGFIFQSVRVGAFFYVVAACGGAARRLLRENGYGPYETG